MESHPFLSQCGGPRVKIKVQEQGYLTRDLVLNLCLKQGKEQGDGLGLHQEWSTKISFQAEGLGGWMTGIQVNIQDKVVDIQDIQAYKSTKG